MSNEALDLLENMCWAIAACAGIAAACFELCDRMQTEEERARSRFRYGKMWRAIETSGLLELPEKVITGVLAGEERLREAVVANMDALSERGVSEWFILVMFPVMLAIAVVGFCIEFGVILWLVLGVSGGVFLLVGLLLVEELMGNTVRSVLGGALIFLASLCLLPLYILGCFFSVKPALTLPIEYAAVIMLLALPYQAMYVAIVSVLDANVFRFGISVSASFSLTLFSLLIGKLVLCPGNIFA